jgi:hypothetical protein
MRHSATGGRYRSDTNETIANIVKRHLPTRLCVGAALAALMSAPPALARWRAQPGAPPATLKPNRPAVRPGRPAQQREDHLQQWMEQHRNLPLNDQMRELDNIPGFRELPQKTQQRYRDEIAKLYNMTPQQRDRILERTEALERLTPEQRQQWNGAVQQFNALPAPRLNLVRTALRHLREMPPAQREEVIDSAPFRSQFSDGERGMLKTLLTGEPYPPIGSPEGP